MKKTSVNKIHFIKIKVPNKKKALNLRLASSLIILSLAVAVFSGLLMTGRTVAFFYDYEFSGNNIFSADILDFGIKASGSLSDWAGSYREASGSFEIYLPEDGSYKQEINLTRSDEGDFKYKVTTYKISGQEPVCQNLQLSASVDGLAVYDGNLLAFSSTETLFEEPGDDWQFNISLPGTPFELQAGQYCEFSILFKGWQDNLLSFPLGFHDKERISNKVYFEPTEEFTADFFNISTGNVQEDENTETKLLTDTLLTDDLASPSIEGVASPSLETTPEPTPTITPSPTPTPVPSETPAPSSTPEPSSSPTPQPSSNPSPTPVPEVTPSPSPEALPSPEPAN